MGTDKPQLYLDLAEALRVSVTVPTHLKAILLSQWSLESNFGDSKLAKEFLNFGGLKWRDEMKGYALKRFLKTPSEPEGTDWCKFDSVEKFIEGYWHFVHRSPYPEIDDAARWNDLEYLLYLKKKGYASDPNYVEKVTKIRDFSINLLGVKSVGVFQGSVETPPRPPRSRFIKPSVTWKPTNKYSSRRGVGIDTIVLHYTAGSTDESALATLTTSSRQASAHFLIGRNNPGKIWQMVSLQNSAWHAIPVNRRSIGIEHTANVGDRLTGAQERSTVALISWLLQEYGLSYKAISAHKWTPYATSCPGNLFGDGNPDQIRPTLQGFLDWRFKHFAENFPAVPGDSDRVVVG